MKKCKKCQIEKSEDSFAKSSSTKDGLFSWCRACKSEYSKALRTRNPKFFTPPICSAFRQKCNKCNEEKPASKFHKNRDSKTGLSIWCKACAGDHYHNRTKPIRQTEEGKLRKKNSALKYSYNMSLEEYHALLEHQDHKCAICKQGTRNKRLAVDHNHITGEVRGLLCGKCNTALGLFQDSIDVINSAVLYLKTKGTYGK